MRMVDLIRAQQKAKKTTAPAQKSAQEKGATEPESDRSKETSAPSQEAWKVPLTTVAAPPAEPTIFARKYSGARDLYDEAEACLRTVFNAASRGEPIAIAPVADMAEQLAKAAAKENLQRASTESFVRCETFMLRTLDANGETYDLVRQSLNVAIYALKLGNVLDYPLAKLTKLALAGMLHNIGMTRCPEVLLTKSGLLSKGEHAIIQAHPIHSYEILRSLGPTWEWLAEVAAQHHEREDGTGYPKGLRGDQIHKDAKIIGICEIYEAMAHARPYRDAFAPFEIVKQILRTEREHFSHVVLRALINGLSSYPVGSWVRLSTKEICRVVATNKANPLRPVLEVWSDASGEKLPQPRLLDLSKEILLHIIGPATQQPRTE
ncbi:HD-GYP domain-containing protein [Candidatus Methylomirabilis sp.]|uniref:HD-GYP domain-containing protein n=1 Tax=Candidatus Methylomirabilis sp. TaxID=2032687 RepID=UPI002A65039D|nr:HD-GYP domain-containing protein [Candidatus Methylomirabilis sp.]